MKQCYYVREQYWDSKPGQIGPEDERKWGMNRSVWRAGEQHFVLCSLKRQGVTVFKLHIDVERHTCILKVKSQNVSPLPITCLDPRGTPDDMQLDSALRVLRLSQCASPLLSVTLNTLDIRENHVFLRLSCIYFHTSGFILKSLLPPKHPSNNSSTPNSRTNFFVLFCLLFLDSQIYRNSVWDPDSCQAMI